MKPDKKFTLQKTILTYFLIVGFLLLIELKILGAYYPSPLEKHGFCKFVYGEKFKWIDEKCVKIDEEGRTITEDFHQSHFIEVCPKPNFISSQFFSECWHGGKT